MTRTNRKGTKTDAQAILLDSAPFTLPPLPFADDALEPLISAETLKVHHGDHHGGYVERLNALLEESPFAHQPLKTIIRGATGELFNMAAQHFNHSFYWQCLGPPADHAPEGPALERLAEHFGGLERFEEEFKSQAAGLFGSGWCWLVERPDGRLAIVQSSDAGCPIASGWKPLLTCDVWEHAYYLDRRSDRRAYLDCFWKCIDWGQVAHAAGGAQTLESKGERR